MYNQENSIIHVGAVSMEEVRNVDFYMPESFKKYQSDLNYRLDIFIRAIESISSRYPQIEIESCVNDIAHSIMGSMVNYFHDFEGDDDILKGIEDYIRYLNDFILTSIKNYMHRVNRMSIGSRIGEFTGIASNNPMSVGDYGIGFSLTSTHYSRGQINKPQDVIMNVYWMVR